MTGVAPGALACSTGGMQRLVPLAAALSLIAASAGCHRTPSRPTSAPDAGRRNPQRPSPAPAKGDAGAASGRAAPPARQTRAHVVLVPLGRVPARLLAAVAAGLRRELQVSVERHRPVPLPRSAYYPRRRRYRADRLLAFLGTRFRALPASTRVLGLTTVDISTTKGRYADWGVFGLGDLGGRACVISTFRLKRRARSVAHLRFRVVTTAIHEVGHTLGLEHCTEPRCVMLDAHGSIANTDTSTGTLGPACKARLRGLRPR